MDDPNDSPCHTAYRAHLLPLQPAACGKHEDEDPQQAVLGVQAVTRGQLPPAREAVPAASAAPACSHLARRRRPGQQLQCGEDLVLVAPLQVVRAVEQFLQINTTENTSVAVKPSTDETL